MTVPKILLKVFVAIFILVVIYFIFVFFVFIPKIESNAITLEDTLGKVQLENTVQLVQNYAKELKDYKTVILQERKDELKKLTQVAYDIININYKKSLLPHADTKALQKQTLNLIEHLQYSNNDYFYVSNYQSVLISHPYLQNRDFSRIKDIHGKLIVPSLVAIARSRGDGFIRYWWKKNNTEAIPYEKLTYAKNFRPWHWVVGTGVYIDDIDKEVQKRKRGLLQKLKKILITRKVGKHGYIYIFDTTGTIIIHQNKKLEGKNFKNFLNPGKKTFILNDLINAYKYGNKTLYYKWDSPDDRGHYTHKKISWIEYEPDFKWYICSSEYLNDAHATSSNLKKFMVYSILIMVFFILAVGLYFLKQVFNPILTLAKNAQEVIDGNLDARYTDVISNDEIGLLARQYNTMLDTIKMQINVLDKRVEEKTQKLTKALEEKNMLLKEINHRVKNNLHIINSIIGLQGFQNKEISLEDFIQTLQERIQSMAVGHEMLTQNGGFDNLNVQYYIPRLVQSLIEAYIKDPTSCECVYDISPIELSLDRLLSCGLIINELVTNAVKYAFKNSDNYLFVSFKDKDKDLELVVEDRGLGFSQAQSPGVGIELIEMLVQQMNGTISFNFKTGVRVIINFPK